MTPFHNKKTNLKILIDIMMTIIFMCLTKIKITGIHMHEVFGIVVTLLVAIHLVLNFSWVKNMTTKILNKNMNSKMRRLYCINVILILLTLIVFVSGILVSVTIITNISAVNRSAWILVHKRSAILLVITIAIHILFNIKIIKAHCKKMCKYKNIKNLCNK